MNTVCEVTISTRILAKQICTDIGGFLHFFNTYEYLIARLGIRFRIASQLLFSKSRLILPVSVRYDGKRSEHISKLNR